VKKYCLLFTSAIPSRIDSCTSAVIRPTNRFFLLENFADFDKQIWFFGVDYFRNQIQF
jgi:hypothetical protein